MFSLTNVNPAMLQSVEQDKTFPLTKKSDVVDVPRGISIRRFKPEDQGQSDQLTLKKATEKNMNQAKPLMRVKRNTPSMILKPEAPLNHNSSSIYARKGFTHEKLQKQLKFALSQNPAIIPEAQSIPFKPDFSIIPSRKPSTFGMAHDRGLRIDDEDAFCSCEIILAQHTMLFLGVFDGHGDQGTYAIYAASDYPIKLKAKLENLQDINENSIINAIVSASYEIDHELKERNFGKTTWGTCALGALKIVNDVYLFNIGDSRAILECNGKPYQLTEDQKPVDERMKRSIRKIEKEIIDGRVGGIYSVARNLGSEMLSWRPKITRVQKSEQSPNLDEGIVTYQKGNHLILACDGFWDVISNDDAAKAIQQMHQDGCDAEQMALVLTQAAKTKWEEVNSKLNAQGGFPTEGDNISVIVLKL